MSAWYCPERARNIGDGRAVLTGASGPDPTRRRRELLQTLRPSEAGPLIPIATHAQPQRRDGQVVPRRTGAGMLDAQHCVYRIRGYKQSGDTSRCANSWPPDNHTPTIQTNDDSDKRRFRQTTIQTNDDSDKRSIMTVLVPAATEEGK